MLLEGVEDALFSTTRVHASKDNVRLMIVAIFH
jgi:hypothetical protein